MIAVAKTIDTNKKDTAGNVLSAKDTSNLRNKKLVIGNFKGEIVYADDDSQKVIKRINKKDG